MAKPESGRERTRYLSNLGVLLAVLLIGAAVVPAAKADYGFVPTGNMTTERSGQTATLLPSGKVLITGGRNAVRVMASAELYDPATGTFSGVGKMTTARMGHSATLLPNGKVLIAGGTDAEGALSSAELYDPATGTFTETGSMPSALGSSPTTLLSNGKVLILGAVNQLYDPALGTFTETGNIYGGAWRTATLLPNGKVLVTSTGLNVEIYDPLSGTFSETGSLGTLHSYLSATLLSDGNVLVALSDGLSNVRASSELYNSRSGTFSKTGSTNAIETVVLSTLLANGTVLVSGDANSSSDWLASAELYDPVSGTYTATGSMAAAHLGGRATLLTSGKVLVTGGSPYPNGGFLSAAEVYTLLKPTLRGVPSAFTKLKSASISFSGGSGSLFSCSVDGGAFSACSSPRAFTGLVDGPHSIAVKETDSAAMVSDRAVANWTVDTLNPAAPVFTSKPLALSNASSPSFGFRGEAGAVSSCSIDGGTFKACTSPKTLSSLKDGRHTFAVKQTDRAGNTGPAVSYTWNVDLTPPLPPVFLSGVAPSFLSGVKTSATKLTSATFDFAAPSDKSFSCSVDLATAKPCSSPLRLSGLKEGVHTVDVVHADSAGNKSSARARWTIDKTPPRILSVTKGGNTGQTSFLTVMAPDKSAITNAETSNAATKPLDSALPVASKVVKYKYPLVVSGPSARLYWLRVQDLATNWSSWFRVG